MFSAFGATLGSIRHEITQTFLRRVQDLEPTALDHAFEELKVRVLELLSAEPQGASPTLERILEARFVGQLFELRIPLGHVGERFPSQLEIEQMFRSQYSDEYGFDLPDAQVQAVNLRLVAEVDLGHRGDIVFAGAAGLNAKAEPCRFVNLLQRDGTEQRVPVYRATDSAGSLFHGPAIIEHSGSTVWIHSRQSAKVGGSGEVLVSLSGGGLRHE